MVTARERKVRAAVVGAGLMGFWHARALRRAGGKPVLIVDKDLDRARRLAHQYPGCDAAAHIDSLATHSIRVAHVCTPTVTHSAIIRAALEAGCHVLVEKPLAHDETTTRALLALAELRSLRLCPVHQVLFQRGVRHALAILDRLRPLHVDLVTCSAGAQGRPDGDDDLVAEILPHPLSFLHRVFPRAPESGVWKVSSAGPGELRATLESAAGTASILISTHGRPMVNGARLIGERGTLYLDFFHGFVVSQDGDVSRTRKVLQPFVFSARLGVAAAWNLLGRAVHRQTAYPGLWELISSFYGALGPQALSPIPAHEIVGVSAMRDAVLSARSMTTLRP